MGAFFHFLFGHRGLVISSLICALAAAAIWYWGLVLPAQRAAVEAHTLAGSLASVVRAENLDPEQRNLRLADLKTMKIKGPVGQEVLAGAQAFLADDLKRAADHFGEASRLDPQAPQLWSFMAAANLRQGNPALAAEQYRRALDLKQERSDADLDQDLASDQLGLALSLFMLHRPDQALPLAEEAWRIRRQKLGPDDPDTLSAANRLATIYVALSRNDEAEKLLKDAYHGALRDEEMAALLEETRLLLTVLYRQSGRQDELEDFFNQEPPEPPLAASAEAPVKWPPAFRPPLPEFDEAPPAFTGPPPILPPATAENLAAWETAADRLAGHDDVLAADLRLRILQGREVLENLDRHQPALRPALLALVRAYLAAGEYARAAEELQPLEEKVGRSDDEFVDYSDLLAQSLAGQGRLKEAEARWQAAADLVDARLPGRAKAAPPSDPEDVAYSLDLHLKLADLFLKQGRVPLEAEIELRAALNRLDKKMLDEYPDIPRVYLRLARLLWTSGQTRESAEYYRRAQASAETLLKREAEPGRDRAALERLLREAADEAASLAAQNPAPDFAAAPPRAETELPSPDVLRQELTALGALGRRSEFQARLAPALAEAARRFGPASQQYMRYYSLKLKGLEEEGRIEELTAELWAQAASPPGRGEAERALNSGSALIYAARANEAAGRLETAVELYRQALTALSGRDEESIIARRGAVEGALERLRKAKGGQAAAPKDVTRP